MEILEFVKDSSVYALEEHRLQKLGSSSFLTIDEAKKDASDEYHCNLAFLKLVANGEINFGFNDQRQVSDPNSPVFAVIGGGISGIISSIQLRNLCRSYSLPDPYIVVCEADSAMGGRVRGHKIPFRADIASGFKPEYGCQFLFDIDHRIQRLCDQLKWKVVPVRPVYDSVVYNTFGQIIEKEILRSVLDPFLEVINAIDRSSSSTVATEFNTQFDNIFDAPSTLEIQIVNLFIAELEYRYGSFDIIYPCHLPVEVSEETFKKYYIGENASDIVVKFDHLIIQPESDDLLKFNNDSSSLDDLNLKAGECGIYAYNECEITSVSASPVSGGNSNVNVVLTTSDEEQIRVNGAIITTPPHIWSNLVSDSMEIQNVVDRIYKTHIESANLICQKLKTSGYFYVLPRESDQILSSDRGLHYFFRHIKDDCSVLTSFSVGSGAKQYLNMSCKGKYQSIKDKVSFLNIRAEDVISSNFGNNRFVAGGSFRSDPDAVKILKNGVVDSLHFASDCLENGTLAGSVASGTLAAASTFRKYYKSLFDFGSNERDHLM
eukprot:NODE_286_length_10728_cov_0.553298.p2 type:complete len:547 gc:universal NODE_286_length_10728_cov_0.553298:3325-1685(-)